MEFTGSIEVLSADHDKRSFTCGVSALDEYLCSFARQHATANISRTYVAAKGAAIHWYYSFEDTERCFEQDWIALKENK